MHPNSQNNGYRSYSYIHPSISTSSQNTYYQYYNSRRRPQQFRYSNGAAINTYAFSHLQQRYQPSVGISDLAEPVSVFDDLQYSSYRSSDAFPFSLVYTTSNTSRRRLALSEERLATANAMRERLLNDIQQNINEIDREITSLEQRSTFSQYIRSGHSPFPLSQRKSLDKITSSTNNINSTQENKPRKGYNVIPRITSQPKKTSTPQVSQNLIDETTSQLFFSRYHYAAEAEEIEINEYDAEYNDVKSIVNEISPSNLVEPMSLEKFRREQSALSQHRALIVVPQYIDNEQTETTEDFHQNNTFKTVTAQSSIVNSSNHPSSSNKLNIQDFKALTHTAPKSIPIIPPAPSNEPKSEEIPEKTETNLINTMLSNHEQLSTKTEETLSSSQEALVNPKRNIDVDKEYFFSDFGEIDEGEEDLISIDPRQFKIPTDGELYPEDNISNNLIRQSRTSLSNPHSSKQQQQQQQQRQEKLIRRNNNEHVEETESEKIDSTTKHIITSPSTASTKKLFPISIYDNMQTQLTHTNNNVNEHQREPLPATINSNLIKQSSKNELNNLTTSQRQISSKDRDTLREQRSASPLRSPQHESIYALSRNASISPSDIHKSTGNIQENKESIRSRSNSPIPIPLNSPDFNINRPSSTSRSPTPQRRNSIPYFDQDILRASADIFDHDERNVEHLTTNIENKPRSPLADITFTAKSPSNDIQLEDNQEHNLAPSISVLEQERHHLESVSPTDIETKESEYNFLELPLISINPQEKNQSKNVTLKPKLTNKDEIEEYPFVAESQKRSKLSLLVHQPKVKEHKSIHIEKHTTVTINDEKDNHHDVFFSKDIPYSSIMIESNSSNNWRERIDRLLSKKRFPRDKYAHIKSRVNSFGNFDHQPRKYNITTTTKLRSKSEPSGTRKTQNNSLRKGRSSQNFGRLWLSPDGRPRIFHEKLQWNTPSKLKAYSLENLHYKSRQKNIQSSQKTRRWDSESQNKEIEKMSPCEFVLTESVSLPILVDQPPKLENEMKIFDVNSNEQLSNERFTDESLISKRSKKFIFDEKLAWKKKSKIKSFIWENINYQSKKSTIQIFHQPTYSIRQSKFRLTHSVTFNIPARVHYISESDIHLETKKKALFSQFHTLQWNDITNEHIHALDHNYPLLSLNADVRDHVEENSDNTTTDESPANRPKWNSVSKTRSVNTVYNPKLSDSSAIRKGWDIDLRQRRTHQLPPIKRKKTRNTKSQLINEAPSTNKLLAIKHNDHHPMRNRITSIDYTTTPSRRSSKALIPLPPLPDFRLLSETPRSQRPVQQEWYDKLNKPHSTQRTEVAQIRHNSFQDSMGSLQQTTTPRELRSSTRNSQTSFVVNAVLDSSIRTNRTTELRLSRDMDEHHQHSHDPHQSMPFEIRGFRLEGTSLIVPDNTSIRPLSNVNYRTSEQVKTRRSYPWSVLHSNRTYSRNSSLLPITEMRYPSLNASLAETPPLIHEE